CLHSFLTADLLQQSFCVLSLSSALAPPTPLPWVHPGRLPVKGWQGPKVPSDEGQQKVRGLNRLVLKGVVLLRKKSPHFSLSLSPHTHTHTQTHSHTHRN